MYSSLLVVAVVFFLRARVTKRYTRNVQVSSTGEVPERKVELGKVILTDMCFYSQTNEDEKKSELSEHILN